MKTYEIKCQASFARTLKIQHEHMRNPYAENTHELVTIGFEQVSDTKIKEEILLQFLSKPKNLQFAGKLLIAEEITPTTVKYRKEKYEQDIRDAEAKLQIAREFFLQLL